MGQFMILKEAKLNDEKRQKDLENLNLTVIRFTNEQIKNEIASVIDIISSTIVRLNAIEKSST